MEWERKGKRWLVELLVELLLAFLLAFRTALSLKLGKIVRSSFTKKNKQTHLLNNLRIPAGTLMNLFLKSPLPASSSSTFLSPPAERRLARQEPARPPPRIM